MRLPIAATCLALITAVSLSACGDRDVAQVDTGSASPSASSTGGSASVPDDLCAVVLPAVTSGWGLSETAHSTDGGTATCELGADGGATTLSVELRATAPGDLDAAFEAACAADDLSTRDETDPEERCTSEASASARVQVAKLVGPSSLLTMRLRTSDPVKEQTAPAEMAAVEFAISVG